jgi:hypothetical protein
MHMGYAMAQAVSRWPLTMEAQVQSEASPHEICGGQSGTRTSFSSSTSVFFCHYHSTNASYALIYLSLMLYCIIIHLPSIMR